MKNRSLGRSQLSWRSIYIFSFAGLIELALCSIVHGGTEHKTSADLTTIIFSSSNGRDVQYPQLAPKITKELQRHNHHTILSQSVLEACKSPTGTSIQQSNVGTAAKVKKLARLAKEQFVSGYYSETIENVSKIIAQNESDPISFAESGPESLENRENLRVSLLYLAHAYLRQEDTNNAEKIMENYIATFPKNAPSTITHSPDLIRFYSSTLAKRNKQASGTIVVHYKGKQPQIYLNGMQVPVNSTSITEKQNQIRQLSISGVPQGQNHILVYTEASKLGKPQTMPQLFCRNVDANRNALVLDYNLDLYQYERSQPHSSNREPHLVYPDENTYTTHAEKNHLQIARRLRAGHTVTLKFSTSAYIDLAYSSTIPSRKSATKAQVMRMATLPIRMLRNDRALSEVISYLITGQPKKSAYFSVPKAKQMPKTLAAKRQSNNILAWTFLGLGLASAGAGVPILMKDGQGTDCNASGTNCENLYDTKLLGWGLIGAGGALIATSVGLFIYAHRPKNQRSPNLQSINSRKNSNKASSWMLTPYISTTSQGFNLMGRF